MRELTRKEKIAKYGINCTKYDYICINHLDNSSNLKEWIQDLIKEITKKGYSLDGATINFGYEESVEIELKRDATVEEIDKIIQECEEREKIKKDRKKQNKKEREESERKELARLKKKYEPVN